MEKQDFLKQFLTGNIKEWTNEIFEICGKIEKEDNDVMKEILFKRLEDVVQLRNGYARTLMEVEIEQNAKKIKED